MLPGPPEAPAEETELRAQNNSNDHWHRSRNRVRAHLFTCCPAPMWLVLWTCGLYMHRSSFEDVSYQSPTGPKFQNMRTVGGAGDKRIQCDRAMLLCRLGTPLSLQQ
eukprot:3470348-Amphidinium_carterae.1